MLDLSIYYSNKHEIQSFRVIRKWRKQVTDIREAKIVPDTNVYQVRRVSQRAGRKVLAELRSSGAISPLITGTHRRLLSFDDAERLANAL